MISLQFASEGGLPSWAIEYYGHGGFAHVDTILPDGNLLGARIKGGVAIRSPGYAPFIKTLRVDLEASKQVTELYYEGLHAELGKPYDGLAIAAFAAGRVWRMSDCWFCSELVAAKLEEAMFFPWSLTTVSNRITPPDLLLAISAVTPFVFSEDL